MSHPHQTAWLAQVADNDQADFVDVKSLGTIHGSTFFNLSFWTVLDPRLCEAGIRLFINIDYNQPLERYPSGCYTLALCCFRSNSIIVSEFNLGLI